MRYFIHFSYRGTNFHGSQTQPNAETVQEVMEKAFFTLLQVPIPLTFAGRTDAGVHAREMVAHCDIAAPIWSSTTEQLIQRLNLLLPDSIALHKIVPVTDTAHARFDATSRTYEYYITFVKNPFQSDMAMRVAAGLDFESMNKAARYLSGRLDCSSFCRTHTDVKTTICHLTEAYWTPITNSEGITTGAVFRISADRFLRNMVRAIVGTLLDVGRGKISIDAFHNVIEQHNRCAAGQSAGAEGLFLTHISYPASIFITQEG